MKEVVVQRLRDAPQQGDIDIVLVENLMDMRACAANVLRQLGGGDTLLPHHIFYMLPDMHALMEYKE